MRMALLITVSALAAFSAGCGGGSSDGGLIGGGGGSTVVAASFEPDVANPGANTIAMAPVGSAGDTVTVAVNITGTNGISSVGMDVTFDPSKVEYTGEWSSGDLFPPCERDGGTTWCFGLDGPSAPGRIVLSLTPPGSPPPIDVSGTATLVHLVFRATTIGNSSLGFEHTALFDSSLTVIPGVSWHGGTIEAD